MPSKAGHESNEERRARLQALLADLSEVHRLAAIELAETVRVLTDCETAMTRLNAMLEDLIEHPKVMATH